MKNLKNVLFDYLKNGNYHIKNKWDDNTHYLYLEFINDYIDRNITDIRV